MRTATVLVCLLLLVGSRARAEEPLDVRLDAAVQRTTGGGFWGAVLVARGGQVLLARGYGNADYATTPSGPDTLFELASISKQLTATAALRLQQQGKLALGDSLRRFFPGAPEDKQAVTVEHLMTHTAGLSQDLGVPYDWPGDRDEYVATVLAPPLVTRPGEAFAYSNVGYALLAAVVEVASGQAFEAYVHEQLLGPAGCADTGFVGERSLIERGAGRTALRLDEGGRVTGTAADWHFGWGYRGMGGVVTTVSDLLRWDRALRGDALLGPAARAELYRARLGGYAGGWMVDLTATGTTRAQHGGAVQGFGATLVRHLGEGEEDVVIAVLSNGRTDVSAVAAALEAIVCPPPTTALALDLSPYELTEHLSVELPGRLEVVPGGLRLIDRRSGHVVATFTGSTRGLRARLEAALTEGGEGDPGDGVEAGVYLASYGRADERVTLRGVYELVALPRYVGRGEGGRTIVDERVTLVIADVEAGHWPVMALLGRKAAEQLLADLAR